MDQFPIGDRFIGDDHRPFIIAEAGANHDGRLDRGKRLVEEAVASGANAVKFQNYTAEKLVTRTASKY